MTHVFYLCEVPKKEAKPYGLDYCSLTDVFCLSVKGYCTLLSIIYLCFHYERKIFTLFGRNAKHNSSLLICFHVVSCTSSVILTHTVPLKQCCSEDPARKSHTLFCLVFQELNSFGIPLLIMWRLFSGIASILKGVPLCVCTLHELYPLC